MSTEGRKHIQMEEKIGSNNLDMFCIDLLLMEDDD